MIHLVNSIRAIWFLCCYYMSLFCFYRILYGDSGPFFALVGVSLASGTGILTKEEELEGVCCEIRVRKHVLRLSFFCNHHFLTGRNFED